MLRYAVRQQLERAVDGYFVGSGTLLFCTVPEKQGSHDVPKAGDMSVFWVRTAVEGRREFGPG